MSFFGTPVVYTVNGKPVGYATKKLPIVYPPFFGGQIIAVKKNCPKQGCTKKINHYGQHSFEENNHHIGCNVNGCTRFGQNHIGACSFEPIKKGICTNKNCSMRNFEHPGYYDLKCYNVKCSKFGEEHYGDCSISSCHQSQSRPQFPKCNQCGENSIHGGMCQNLDCSRRPNRTRKKQNFCGKCGTQYYSNEENFCGKCGKQRGYLN